VRFAPIILSLLALFGWSHGYGVEVLDVTVAVKNNRYHLVGSSIIQAPPKFVFDMFMDYEHFHLLAGGIDETRFIETEDPDHPLGYTRIDSCILFFCRSVEKVEMIDATPYVEIATQAIPEQSDFIYNDSRWTLEETDSGTRLSYEANMEADFWLPPLISRWAIRHKLRRTAESVGENIEYLYANGLTLKDIEKQQSAE
jgi:hypothetical protein